MFWYVLRTSNISINDQTTKDPFSLMMTQRYKLFNEHECKVDLLIWIILATCNKVD